ncbi:MAG: sulfotransferase domain-containing protein [candidate division KSB1 bacterium]|nr:sulfotransferase domain-containing protein [candidate division KSB1 bacterium]
MGNVTEHHKDTVYFSIRTNERVRELILNAYNYLNCDGAEKQTLKEVARKTVLRFVESEIQHNGPFGWKIDPTMFIMPVVLDTFPTAKAIHIIRDGRDVMLSRLDARIEQIDDPVNKLMVFGRTDVDSFEGEPLEKRWIKKLRNELEMQHWVTSVEYGLRGKSYADRYLEVKYEDICHNPIEIFQKIFDFLEVPFQESTKEWLKKAVSPRRIGKWCHLPPQALKRPLEIGGHLLEKLNYL